MKINVGSWNIWIFGSRDFKGIAELVRKNKIDILGIQEAGIYFDKGQENMAKKIAEELNYNFVFYPAKDARPNNPWIVCNAILSKFPIIESNFHLLNPANFKYNGTYQTEPRNLVYSKITLNESKALNFLTTHLNPSIKFETTDLRLTEVEKVLSAIKKLENPIVLTGDFNSIPKNKEIKRIEEFLTRVGGDEPTWTVHPFEMEGWRVDKLEYRLDNIFVSKDLNYENFKIIKSKISDHLPIKVTIDF